MECGIIIDNRGEAATLNTEHGFSVFFKADGLNYMVDTGASHKFIDNMQILSANINESNIPSVDKIDKLIISHGHNDHTGGLPYFIEQNKGGEIILSENIKGRNFFSKKPLRKTSEIGPEKWIFEKYPQRFTYLNKSINLSQHVSIISVYTQNNGNIKYTAPAGNRFLYVNDYHKQREYPDNFNHELAALIKEDDGFIIIAPCSHNGVLNTIEACNNFIKRTYSTISRSNIKAYIGGTHLIDYLPDANEDKIQDIALEINKLYPQMKLISGHCTCENASKILKSILEENYYDFYSGLDLTNIL